ncbi:hypothetical protein Bca52824_042965 [Brassica carinata]|uniref:Uncharacterized protein n=1 Tax=Brassica carinata TaxID=52824 RepID=A0A8X7V089_BRACI|nr:hypothetical protein Bca52824_042965 [Brassica carinata]
MYLRRWKLSAPSSTTNTPPSRDFDFRKLSKLSFRFVSPEIFKFSELDEVNRKQEDEFITFVSASDTTFEK